MIDYCNSLILMVRNCMETTNAIKRGSQTMAHKSSHIGDEGKRKAGVLICKFAKAAIHSGRNFFYRHGSKAKFIHIRHMFDSLRELASYN